MDRFFEGSRSANELASAPRPLPSCHPSHPAKVSGGFLLQTLPAVLHRNFQKRLMRKAGTVFPRWHWKAYLSPLPSIAGEGREGREGRCQTEISKKKKIKEFPQTRRSIRIQAATDSPYYQCLLRSPWSDIRLTTISAISYMLYFIAFTHAFPCTFCVHFFHNS